MIAIPGPDDVIQRGLLFVFGPGFIVVAFAILNAAASWVGTARLSVRGGRAMARGLRASADALSARSATDAAWAVSVGLAILLIQAFWSYLIATYIGFLGEIIHAVNTKQPGTNDVILSLARHARPVAWAWEVAVAAAVLAWLAGTKYPELLGFVTFVLCVPAGIVAAQGTLGTAGAAITLILGGEEAAGVDWGGVVILATIASSGFICVYATILVLRAPQWLVTSTRKAAN